MDSLRRDLNLNDTKSPSPEMFSFPGTPTEEFEFGSCVTPSSPVTPNELTKISTSPADQFFLNGRLLPHDFPPVSTSSRTSFSGRENLAYSTTTTTTSTTTVTSNSINSNAMINLSRGTSVGSNMSIMSSRSNSSNSRGSSTCSTCSNARASTGEVSERKTFHQKSRMIHMKGYCRTASVRDQRNVSSSSSRLGKYYGTTSSGGSSQRWQFITPAPVLGPSLSRRSLGSNTSPKKSTGNSNSNDNSNSNSNSNNGGFLHRILRSFVATCKACHAMEGQENEYDLDERSVVGS
ncbi:hypothetical protein RND81_09G017800 [Saponaria officinalis]|uniref:Uncharacterized protein n=1 Tax=Saponaria officinalis TaxID=3572 RepID=A0AAW1IH14_SAPOF